MKQDELEEKLAKLIKQIRVAPGLRMTEWTRQIIALFPNEEEIRRQERDRIWEGIEASK